MNADIRSGLLGESLSHSVSPLIHSLLGDPDYRLFEIPPDGLARFVDGSRGGYPRCFNVTIPYKRAILPFCDLLSGVARDTGSVNTVLRLADGRLYGANTDCFGFRFLLHRYGIDPAGLRCVVLGGGGAAHTAEYVLRRLGAASVAMISRSGADNYKNLERQHGDAQLIINATPVGMFPDGGALPVPPGSFGEARFICDLIYNPLRTGLLLDAQCRGIPCANGLAMLAAQAFAANILFSYAGGSLLPPDEPDEAGTDGGALIGELLRKIDLQMRNIVLIGMPGCGKSTLGAALAAATGRVHFDTDALITERTGRTPEQLITAEGEDAFRRLETEALASVSAPSGAVISTGGGIVVRRENLRLCRENGLVVFIDSPLSALARAGRPLSGSDDALRRLYSERLPLYRELCDVTLDCSGTSSPDERLSRLMRLIQTATDV